MLCVLSKDPNEFIVLFHDWSRNRTILNCFKILNRISYLKNLALLWIQVVGEIDCKDLTGSIHDDEESNMKVAQTLVLHSKQQTTSDPQHKLTAAEIQDVEKERKAKNILLMAILKEHMRRFHGMDDAKEIWEGPQEPEPNVSDDRSSEYSTCQSNDSAGSIGTSSEHSVDPDLEISSVLRSNSPRTNQDQATPEVLIGELECYDGRELGEGYSFNKEEHVLVCWVTKESTRGFVKNSMGGSVTLDIGSKGYYLNQANPYAGVLEVTNSAGTSQTPIFNASEEKYEDVELIVEPSNWAKRFYQAPRAWYATLSTFLKKHGYRRGTIDKTFFIKKDKKDIMLVQVYVDDIFFGSTRKSWCDEFEALMKGRFQMSSMGELIFFLGLQVKQKTDGIFISQDKYVADMLKKFDLASVKTAITPMETKMALTKDEEANEVDVHLYRSMIGSLMYLTASRPDIMFAVCACSRFQVTPKTSHLNAVKRIFKYLKGKPNLGLWYPRESSFDLEAYSDSDYAGANLDRKSTTGGCQFLGSRLISWQCKKQTIVATSTTEAEYVAAASCCGQVLWIQNQMLDYGFNFMNTKIHIDNESTICIVKNPVYHSKTKHIEIRHHFIRDSYEKKLIRVEKIHTDFNVANLLTKGFDGPMFNFLVVNIEARTMTVEDLLHLVPNLITKLDSLETELKPDVSCHGNAMLLSSDPGHPVTLTARGNRSQEAEERESKRKRPREGKALMIVEETQAPKRTKEQIQQEEDSLAEAIRLQTLEEEETTKQVHLDALLAKIMEEEELIEQQKQRKAHIQFEAQHYTEEDWDAIRAKLEANAELTKNVLGKEFSEEDFAKKMVELVNQRKKFFAEERAKARISKPITQSLLRNYMMNYLKNQGTWKLTQLKKLSFKEVKDEFDKLVKQTEISKKQRIDDKDILVEEKVTEVKEEKPVIRTRKERSKRLGRACSIYMLADRKYPLSKDACQVMLKMKLLDGKMKKNSKMGNNHKISLARFRIIDLEHIINDIQIRHQEDKESLLNAINELKISQEGPSDY
ncbi:putative ribonuclease H-like domain-containing protein [Tanacetum coccineum]|uniref:Ribonuclease H-like domain-containing protein n=1 Tax=Tanacetum coccineum TaxID=301880 RepID=A0ABQ5E250_9ASTR